MIIRMSDGMYSTDSGANWSGPITGWKSGHKVANKATSSSHTSWTLGLSGSGAVYLSLVINGTTYLATTSFDSASATAADVLASLKTLTNGSKIPFKSKLRDPLQPNPSFAQLDQWTVTGTYPTYTVTAGATTVTHGQETDFQYMDFQTNGVADNLTRDASSTGACSVSRASTGSLTDYTINTRAAIDYSQANGFKWVLWFVNASGYGSTYRVDFPGSHAAADGGSTTSLNISSTALQGLVFRGAGADMSVIEFGHGWDDRDAYHTPSSSDCLLRAQQGMYSVTFVDIGFRCMNGSVATNGRVSLFEVNSSKYIRQIALKNVKLYGPGWWNPLGGAGSSTTTANAWGLKVLNTSIGSQGAYVGGGDYKGASSLMNGSLDGIQIPRVYDFVEFDGVECRYWAARIVINQCSNVSIKRCRTVYDNPHTFYGSSSSNAATKEAGGFELSWNRMVGLHYCDISGTIGQTPSGQNESVMTQTGTITNTPYCNKSVATDNGDSITLASALYVGAQTPAGIGQYGFLRGTGTATNFWYVVAVQSGTGAGQWRYLAGIATDVSGNDELQLSSAFDTPLDATSKVTVFACALTMAAFGHNTIRGGLYMTVYTGGMDVVVNDCLFVDGGSLLWRINPSDNAFQLMYNCRASRNVFWDRGRGITSGIQIFYDCTATVTQFTAADISNSVRNLVIDQNRLYSDASDRWVAYGFGNRTSGMNRVMNTGGSYTGKTVTDVEGASGGLYDLGNYVNDVETAIGSTFSASASPTVPLTHAYGTEEPTFGTRANVSTVPSTVTDPTGLVKTGGSAAKAVDYPELPAPL